MNNGGMLAGAARRFQEDRGVFRRPGLYALPFKAVWGTLSTGKRPPGFVCLTPSLREGVGGGAHFALDILRRRVYI